MAAWILQSSTDDGTPIILLLGVVFVAALFGMVASLARFSDRGTSAAMRKLLYNCGAIWILAGAAALQTQASPPLTALMGLGIGMAGGALLEILERGTLALANKILSDHGLVKREELDEKIGEVRQNAQIAVSEAAMKIRDIEIDPEAPRGKGFDDPVI